MSSNDTPDTPTSPEAEPSGDDKRKARVIDGTAEAYKAAEEALTIGLSAAN